MAEVRGLNGRVVRGWLSRMSPGPWDVQAHTDTEVRLHDADGELVAEVELRGHHENAGPIAELPEVLRAYLTVSGELLAIEQALAAAGVDEGGVAGVQALREQLTEATASTRELQRDYDAQGSSWVDTIDQLDAATARLGGVRTLLASWGGRALSDEAMELYRELAGVLMARNPPTPPTEGETPDDADAHRDEA